MSTYVVCPDRDGKKVALEVCLNGCELREVCEEFLEVPAEVINSVRVEATPPEGPIEAGQTPGMSPEEVAKKYPEVMEATDGETPVAPSNRAEEALNHAFSIRNDIEVKFLEMGKVLDEIFGNHYDREYKPDWLETLGIKKRTAIYLRNIYVKMTTLEVPEQECAQIGWTKLAQILPVVNKKNVDHWIKEAKKPGTTAQTLNAKVRVAQGKITEKEAATLPEKMIFSLFKEQEQIVELALDVAGKAAASDKKGYLLADIICPEFLSAYPPGWETLTKGEVIAAILRRYESGFNVKFSGSVIEIETGEVLLSWEK